MFHCHSFCAAHNSVVSLSLFAIECHNLFSLLFISVVLSHNTNDRNTIHFIYLKYKFFIYFIWNQKRWALNSPCAVYMHVKLKPTANRLFKLLVKPQQQQRGAITMTGTWSYMVTVDFLQALQPPPLTSPPCNPFSAQELKLKLEKGKCKARRTDSNWDRAKAHMWVSVCACVCLYVCACVCVSFCVCVWAFF